MINEFRKKTNSVEPPDVVPIDLKLKRPSVPQNHLKNNYDNIVLPLYEQIGTPGDM